MHYLRSWYRSLHFYDPVPRFIRTGGDIDHSIDVPPPIVDDTKLNKYRLQRRKMGLRDVARRLAAQMLASWVKEKPYPIPEDRLARVPDAVNAMMTILNIQFLGIQSESRARERKRPRSDSSSSSSSSSASPAPPPSSSASSLHGVFPTALLACKCAATYSPQQIDSQCRLFWRIVFGATGSTVRTSFTRFTDLGVNWIKRNDEGQERLHGMWNNLPTQLAKNGIPVGDKLANSVFQTWQPFFATIVRHCWDTSATVNSWPSHVGAAFAKIVSVLKKYRLADVSDSRLFQSAAKALDRSTQYVAAKVGSLLFNNLQHNQPYEPTQWEKAIEAVRTEARHELVTYEQYYENYPAADGKQTAWNNNNYNLMMYMTAVVNYLATRFVNSPFLYVPESSSSPSSSSTVSLQSVLSDFEWSIGHLWDKWPEVPSFSIRTREIMVAWVAAAWEEKWFDLLSSQTGTNQRSVSDIIQDAIKEPFNFRQMMEAEKDKAIEAAKKKDKSEDDGNPKVSDISVFEKDVDPLIQTLPTNHMSQADLTRAKRYCDIYIRDQDPMISYSPLQDKFQKLAVREGDYPHAGDGSILSAWKPTVSYGLVRSSRSPVTWRAEATLYYPTITAPTLPSPAAIVGGAQSDPQPAPSLDVNDLCFLKRGQQYPLFVAFVSDFGYLTSPDAVVDHPDIKATGNEVCAPSMRDVTVCGVSHNDDQEFVRLCKNAFNLAVKKLYWFHVYDLHYRYGKPTCLKEVNDIKRPVFLSGPFVGELLMTMPDGQLPSTEAEPQVQPNSNLKPEQVFIRPGWELPRGDVTFMDGWLYVTEATKGLENGMTINMQNRLIAAVGPVTSGMRAKGVGQAADNDAWMMFSVGNEEQSDGKSWYPHIYGYRKETRLKAPLPSSTTPSDTSPSMDDSPGHVRARSIGGGVDPLNFVPQSRVCNVGTWSSAEEYVRGLLDMCPHDAVWIDIRPMYRDVFESPPDPISARPISFHYTVYPFYRRQPPHQQPQPPAAPVFENPRCIFQGIPFIPSRDASPDPLLTVMAPNIPT